MSMSNPGAPHDTLMPMVRLIQNDAEKLYQCEECGLHYKDRATAERCEAWCREHRSCNLEITAHAEENAPKPA